MRILFDNVNFGSRSGPNSFGAKLAKGLSYQGHTIVEDYEKPDVQLSFIQMTRQSSIPIVQRLDGIWFNSEQDWKKQNAPIEATYNLSSAVVFQSEFNKKLTEKFFGVHQESHVIHNGTDVDKLQAIDPLDAPSLVGIDKVWVCASSWRPHKRLAENVRYFQEYSGKNDCLVIAGSNPDVRIADPRVFYAGDLQQHILFSLYRAADYFIHLAWLDHCPNVVVDARAAGAHIICSSAGGTREIAGPGATVIEEDEWDFEPCKLYEPPKMDFSRKVRNTEWDVDIDISTVSKQYAVVLQGVV